MPKLKKRPVSRTDTEGVDGTKYRPIMLVHIYRYAKVGMTEEAICDGIGVSRKTWHEWKRRFPSIDKAIKLGRTEDNTGGTWHKFVYDRLSPDLRELWDRIESYDRIDPDTGRPLLANGVAQIEALLDKHGKLVRQQLFLYALIHNNFSASKACAKVNIDKSTLDHWIKSDPKFGELIEEIKWHKGNFFEESLFRLVDQGDAAAVLFANKTFNRDRGYNPAVDVNVNGTIEHKHNVLDLSDLDLSFECRREIMEAMRRRAENIELQRKNASLSKESKALALLNEDIIKVSEGSTP